MRCDENPILSTDLLQQSSSTESIVYRITLHPNMLYKSKYFVLYIYHLSIFQARQYVQYIVSIPVLFYRLRATKLMCHVKLQESLSFHISLMYRTYMLFTLPSRSSQFILLPYNSAYIHITRFIIHWMLFCSVVSIRYYVYFLYSYIAKSW